MDGPSIYVYDEGIYANNAFEMAQSGDFITLKNNGEISDYNLKPPLVIVCQSFLMKVIGVNEWAVRLPSAISGLLTCLLVFFFTRRHFSTRAAYIALLLLLTTAGFVRVHVTRSGDLDSMLVLFMTMYVLYCSHKIIVQKTLVDKDFYIIGLITLLAFLSKSIAGVLFIPGLLLGIIFFGKWKELLSNKHFYFSGMLVIILALGYYLLRDMYDPGYLDKVIDSEYLRIYKSAMPWHEKPYWFYASNLWNKTFGYYLFLLPFAFSLLISKNKNIKKLSIILISTIVLYLIVISISPVKLDYYDAPIFPLLSIIIGGGIYNVFRILELEMSSKIRNAIFGVFAFCIVVIPFYKIYIDNQNFFPRHQYEEEGYAMRELHASNPSIKDYKLVAKSLDPNHMNPIVFYRNSYNKSYQMDIRLADGGLGIEKGDTILVSNTGLVNEIIKEYDLDTLSAIDLDVNGEKRAYVFRVVGLKE